MPEAQEFEEASEGEYEAELEESLVDLSLDFGEE